MKIPRKPVNPSAQPPLFQPPAVALVLEVLVDLPAEEFTLSVMAHDPVDGQLLMFVSEVCRDARKLDDRVRHLGATFTSALHDAVHPFPN